MREQKQAPRKPGCLGSPFMLLLMIGIAVGMLHYFGKLQPIIDLVRKAEKKEPAEELEPPTVIKKEIPETAQPEVQLPEAEQSELAAMYRAKFRPPKVGSRISLALKSGTKMKGNIEGLTKKNIRIKRENMRVTINRSQLTPISLAKCYEDEYVKYMVALHHRQEAEKKTLDKLIAKLKAEHERQLASQGKLRGTTGAGQTVSANDADFKKWMENQGESDVLKARQKRIAAYEAQRIAAGREY